METKKAKARKRGQEQEIFVKENSVLAVNSNEIQGEKEPLTQVTAELSANKSAKQQLNTATDGQTTSVKPAAAAERSDTSTQAFSGWVKVYGEANPYKTNETLLDVETHTVKIDVRPVYLDEKTSGAQQAGKVDQQAFGTELSGQTTATGYTTYEGTLAAGSELTSYGTAEETYETGSLPASYGSYGYTGNEEASKAGPHGTPQAVEGATSTKQPESTLAEETAETGATAQSAPALEDEQEKAENTSAEEKKSGEVILENEEISGASKGEIATVSNGITSPEGKQGQNEETIATTAIVEEEGTAATFDRVTSRLEVASSTNVPPEAEETSTPAVAEAGTEAPQAENIEEKESAEKIAKPQAEAESQGTTAAIEDRTTKESEEETLKEEGTTAQFEVASAAESSLATAELEITISPEKTTTEEEAEAEKAATVTAHETSENARKAEENETAVNVTEGRLVHEKATDGNATVSEEEFQKAVTVESTTVPVEVQRAIEIEISPKQDAFTTSTESTTETVIVEAEEAKEEGVPEASTEALFSSTEIAEQEGETTTIGGRKEVKADDEQEKEAAHVEEEVITSTAVVEAEGSTADENVEEKTASSVSIADEYKEATLGTTILAKLTPKEVKPAAKALNETTADQSTLEITNVGEQQTTRETIVISTTLPVSERSTMPALEESTTAETVELSTISERRETVGPIREVELEGAEQPKLLQEGETIEVPIVTPTVIAKAHKDEEENIAEEQSTVAESTVANESLEKEEVTATEEAQKAGTAAGESKKVKQQQESFTVFETTAAATAEASTTVESATMAAEVGATTAVPGFEETTALQQTVFKEEFPEKNITTFSVEVVSSTEASPGATEAPSTAGDAQITKEKIPAGTKYVSGTIHGEGAAEHAAKKTKEVASEPQYAGMSIEPSGYDVNVPEQAIGYVGVPPVTSNTGHPFTMDCATEVDEKGVLCEDWAKGGLCTTHRPTMFLFCRRTCLCTGPPEDAR
ncbi:unnamed protein product [Toxocara canis]|uniref:ShKT domain-containing protein n=1 Tax=Toxocara canis TaxID=6265 RepID=A0A183TUW0_TOXCA|nr:unnamed protein product [Toxocara canis]